MYTSTLRRIGGSVMLTIPPALLDILHVKPGSKVRLTTQGGRLIVEPHRRPRYTLNELLAQCNPGARRSKEDREWLSSKPIGGELI